MVIINKKYIVPLVGYYNAMFCECRDCGHSVINDLFNHIIGFSDSDTGMVAIVECPKCFEKFYFHVDDVVYLGFIGSIRLGTQKHFKYVYE